MIEPKEPDRTTAAEDAALVENLVAECLERLETDGSDAIEQVCARHPKHASEVRRWIAFVRDLPTERPTPSVEIPKQFGDFEILRQRGSGGMGLVFEARQLSLDRRVALKVIRPERLIQEGSRTRFAREAQALAHLSHPGIVPVHAIGEVHGLPFLTMPLLRGGTLADVIEELRRDGAVTPSDVDAAFARRGIRSKEAEPWPRRCTRLILRVAEALAYAHDRGVFHRDVKPSNVVLEDAETPVIIDFGLARVDDATSLTRTGAFLGSLPYMAPEQLEGSASDDAGADVYAVGVLLYELLTLESPFLDDTSERTRRRILGGHVVSPRRVDSTISRDLETVCLTAMDRDPARRYASMGALAEDLRRLRDRRPILARPAGPWLRGRRWMQRHPAIVASLALGALVLLGIAGFAWTQKTSLARYERVADVVAVYDLIEEEPRLWPRHPRLIPRFDTWLANTDRLLARADRHREEYAALQDTAQPPRPDDAPLDEAARRRAHPQFFRELENKEAQVRSIRDALETRVLSARRRRRYTSILEDAEARLGELRSDPRRSERHVWKFSAAGDAFRYQALRRLVRGLDSLVGKRDDVRARRSFATLLEQRTVHDAAWTACIRDVETSDTYGGLTLSPQLGLVPLGRDQDSGLWEFWHVGSGPRPGWKGPVLGGKLEPMPRAGIVFVLLPGGSTRVGAQTTDPTNPRFDPQAEPREAPVHSVSVAPLFLAKHEMTQAQWLACMPRNPSYHRPGVAPFGQEVTPANPVTNVTWPAANHALFRFGLRLPTEAEWEYAARAGTDTRYWTGADAVSLQGAENVADRSVPARLSWRPDRGLEDGHVIHAPVGSFRANPFGFHDMAGNVCEWCADWHAPYRPRAREFPDPRSGTRAARGGSYGLPPRIARSSQRGRFAPSASDPALGVRAARSLETTR